MGAALVPIWKFMTSCPVFCHLNPSTIRQGRLHEEQELGKPSMNTHSFGIVGLPLQISKLELWFWELRWGPGL